MVQWERSLGKMDIIDSCRRSTSLSRERAKLYISMIYKVALSWFGDTRGLRETALRREIISIRTDYFWKLAEKVIDKEKDLRGLKSLFTSKSSRDRFWKLLRCLSILIGSTSRMVRVDAERLVNIHTLLLSLGEMSDGVGAVLPTTKPYMRLHNLSFIIRAHLNPKRVEKVVDTLLGIGFTIQKQQTSSKGHNIVLYRERLLTLPDGIYVKIRESHNILAHKSEKDKSYVTTFQIYFRVHLYPDLDLPSSLQRIVLHLDDVFYLISLSLGKIASLLYQATRSSSHSFYPSVRFSASHNIEIALVNFFNISTSRSGAGQIPLYPTDPLGSPVKIFIDKSEGVPELEVSFCSRAFVNALSLTHHKRFFDVLGILPIKYILRTILGFVSIYLGQTISVNYLKLLFSQKLSPVIKSFPLSCD